MKNATLRQLRVFESAARHLSLTRAAEELHLTPPAVSIQVGQLEGHAGAELFERVGRGLRLTPAGREVLARAREILAQIEAAEQALEGLGSVERGLLDAAVINAGDYFFPWLVAAFRKEHPAIRARITVCNREDVLERLAERAVDIGIMSHPPTDPAFTATAFAPHPHVIVAPPGHRLVRRRGIALEALAGEPLLTREPGSATRLALEQACAEMRVVPRIDMEIASNETLKQAVAAGFGLGFLSAHAVREEIALGRLAVVPVKGFPVMRQWYVVHRADRRLPRVAEAFERFLIERGAKLIRAVPTGAARAPAKGRR